MRLALPGSLAAVLLGPPCMASPPPAGPPHGATVAPWGGGPAEPGGALWEAARAPAGASEGGGPAEPGSAEPGASDALAGAPEGGGPAEQGSAELGARDAPAGALQGSSPAEPGQAFREEAWAAPAGAPRGGGPAERGGAPPGPCPGCVPVFYPGLNGSRCYRIPTVIRTHEGTLLAFAENRIDGCEDNGPHHQLVLRRSSDLGRTWGPLILVADGRQPCAVCPAAISNPNPVEVLSPGDAVRQPRPVLLENGSRAVLLHYDTLNNPRRAAHGLDMQTWSLDDGRTWHGGEVLSYPPEQNDGSLIGPSVGLQDARGVIFFSANRVDGSGHFLYHSADRGRSWVASAPIPVSGECSIAFLVGPLDGRLLVNCRTGRGQRAQVVMSANGTSAGEVFWPPELVDPGCQGSIVNDDGVLYFSNANTRHHRANMTVKRSVDQGLTWSPGVLVWDGPSGYSQLVPLGRPTEIGLLFESKMKGNHTDTVLSFVRVPVEAEQPVVLI